MVIVDTTVWVDYLNGVHTPETVWFERESLRQRLGLLDLMVCEILQGLSTDAEATRVLRLLRRFEIFETGGVDLAAAAARNYRRLRSRGKTVRRTIDCLIATFCLERDHALLHRDRDFDAFEEILHLEVVHPDGTRRGFVNASDYWYLTPLDNGCRTADRRSPSSLEIHWP